MTEHNIRLLVRISNRSIYHSQEKVLLLIKDKRQYKLKYKSRKTESDEPSTLLIVPLTSSLPPEIKVQPMPTLTEN